MKKAGYLWEDMGELKKIYDMVLGGEDDGVRGSVQAALAKGIKADQILSGALIPAMTEVGRLFEAHEYYLPEIIISAEAMKAGVAILRTLLRDKGDCSAGRIALGAVEGDLHDIGKNLVIMMLEGAGFHVTDLGVDVSPRKFVQAVIDGAQVIGMSAMLPTTMPNMKVVIETIKAEDLRKRVKVIVGGALVTKKYADEIGADGCASDANMAVREVKELLSGIPKAEVSSESLDVKTFPRLTEAKGY